MSYTIFQFTTHNRLSPSMDTAGPVASASTLTVTNPPAVRTWQVGQRLNAIVTAINGRGNISLKVGGVLLQAKSSITANVGQPLALEVIRSDSQVVMRIIPPTSSTTPDALATALRETLPHQQPLQTVLSQFTDILKSTKLPSDTTRLLETLIGQLATPETITQAGALKQAIMDSGQFLEHKLNTQSDPESLNADLKAKLLKLLTASGQSHDPHAQSLAKHTEAALARIQLTQLAALVNTPPAMAAWSGELPVRRDNEIDVFQWQIEKDGNNKSNEEQQQKWTTWLRFNISSLGPVCAKLTLAHSTVTATLWAESDTTAALINHHLQVLHQSLGAVGLAIRELQCLPGSPNLPSGHRLPSGFLDLTV